MTINFDEKYGDSQDVDIADPYAKYGPAVSEELDNESHPYFGQYSHLTPAQYQKLPQEEKQKLQNYVPLTGVGKGFLSGATLGGTQQIPSLKVEEHEKGSGIGEFGGVVAPIGVAAKIISAPIRAIQGLVNLGRAATIGTEIAGSTLTGAAYGAAKEGAKSTRGEEVDLTNIPIEAATFGGLHGLFKAGTGAYSWLKSLNPKQQAKVATKGILPDDLKPTEYKMFEEQVVPELQQAAKEEYEAAFAKAVEENDLAYKQELANVQAKHEQDLYQRQQAGQLTEQENAAAQKQYQLRLKNIAAKHETEMAELQKANEEAEKAFQQQQQEFERMKARQQAVSMAIQPKEGGESLAGRVSQTSEGVSQRPTTPPRNEKDLKADVGKIFTPEPVDIDSTHLGETTTLAIRANDRIDRRVVNEAYSLNEELNSKINAPQEELASQLLKTIKKIGEIEPSPQQKQLVTFAESLLKKIATLEEGRITGIIEVNNSTLQEQAKAMRQAMDYDFEHGNTRGIFTPTVNQIEDAVESAAILSGNEAAADASKEARLIYSEWVRDYDNPYIKPFRDLNNFDYSRNYKALSNVDEYNVAKKILIKSNAGQQVNNINKRGVVFNKLDKFMENPRKTNQKKFDEEMTELRAVITPEQDLAIRQQFNEAKKTPPVTFKAKKTTTPEEAKALKKKEIKSVEVGQAPSKKKAPEPVSKVTIPTKSEVKPTPAMKVAAQQMKITPEEAISKSNTPSGMKQLKEKVTKETFEKIAKQKNKSILYEGNAEREFTGSELYPLVNKNYDMFSVTLGDEAAADLLVTTKQIANKSVTVDTLKSLGMKAGTIKTLLLFGIL